MSFFFKNDQQLNMAKSKGIMSSKMQEIVQVLLYKLDIW